MKKFWKISACTLSMAFAFSAATACDKDKGERVEKSNITADQVLALGDSIAETLADVQSFSFGFSTKSGTVMPGSTTESGVGLTAKANLTENGMDAAITATITEKTTVEGAPDFNTDDVETASAYLIDGFAYMQDPDDETGKTFEKSSRPIADMLMEELLGAADIDLSAILEEIASTETEIALPEISIPADVIKNFLNDEFTLIQKGDVTRVTLDLKEEFNDSMKYIGSLSVNTKVGDIVNKALGDIDENLTWQTVTDAVKGAGSVKVGLLIYTLDGAAESATGMGLQEIKDALLSEQTIYDALAKALGAEMMEEVKNTTVNDFVTAYGEYTVNNLLQMVTEDETVTVAGAVDRVESVLSTTTLGDLMETEEEKEEFAEMISLFKGIRAEELNANLIFTVKNGTLTRAEVSQNVKITVSVQGMSMSVFSNVSFYAENFNAEAQTIALPADSTVVVCCDDCEAEVTEDDYCDICKAYLCETCHGSVQHAA